MAETTAVVWGLIPCSIQPEEYLTTDYRSQLSWKVLWPEIRVPLQAACEVVTRQAAKLTSCTCGLGFDDNLDDWYSQGTTDSCDELPVSYDNTARMEWGNDSPDDGDFQDIPTIWDGCPGPFDTTGIEWGNDKKFWELGNGETRAEEESPQEDPTRLHETQFDNEASTHIEIESATGLRLLTEALVIAKEAWYDFCHQYQWDIWRDYFPSGPHEVLLETPMIEEYIGRWHHDHTPPGVTYLSATPALRCVKHLRNAVCHFRPVDWAIKDYDRLLQYAQALAVALNDEARAQRVRGLRDELREVAADTLSDIQNLGLTSVVPFRREWKPHHEWFLGGVVNRLNAGHGAVEYEHGPAVWLAVDAWKWQRQSFGLDHEEYEVNELFF